MLVFQGTVYGPQQNPKEAQDAGLRSAKIYAGPISYNTKEFLVQNTVKPVPGYQAILFPPMEMTLEPGQKLPPGKKAQYGGNYYSLGISLDAKGKRTESDVTNYGQEVAGVKRERVAGGADLAKKMADDTEYREQKPKVGSTPIYKVIDAALDDARKESQADNFKGIYQVSDYSGTMTKEELAAQKSLNEKDHAKYSAELDASKNGKVIINITTDAELADISKGKPMEEKWDVEKLIADVKASKGDVQVNITMVGETPSPSLEENLRMLSEASGGTFRRGKNFAEIDEKTNHEVEFAIGKIGSAKAISQEQYAKALDENVASKETGRASYNPKTGTLKFNVEGDYSKITVMPQEIPVKLDISENPVKKNLRHYVYLDLSGSTLGVQGEIRKTKDDMKKNEGANIRAMKEMTSGSRGKGIDNDNAAGSINLGISDILEEKQKTLDKKTDPLYGKIEELQQELTKKGAVWNRESDFQGVIGLIRDPQIKEILAAAGAKGATISIVSDGGEVKLNRRVMEEIKEDGISFVFVRKALKQEVKSRSDFEAKTVETVDRDKAAYFFGNPSVKAMDVSKDGGDFGYYLTRELDGKGSLKVYSYYAQETSTSRNIRQYADATVPISPNADIQSALENIPTWENMRVEMPTNKYITAQITGNDGSVETRTFRLDIVQKENAFVN